MRRRQCCRVVVDDARSFSGLAPRQVLSQQLLTVGVVLYSYETSEISKRASRHNAFLGLLTFCRVRAKDRERTVAAAAIATIVLTPSTARERVTVHTYVFS